MSLKPGIGSNYYDKNPLEFFPQDFVMLEPGKKLEVPKYYKTKLKQSDPEMSKRLSNIRIKKSLRSPDNTKERLAVRNQIQTIKIDKLKRELE